MKIILGTTAIVTILVIGLLGINNSFSQGNGTAIIENDKIMSINSTLPTPIISNATLAFGQEGTNTTEGVNNTMPMFNDTSMTIMNATFPVSLTGNNTAKPMN